MRMRDCWYILYAEKRTLGVATYQWPAYQLRFIQFCLAYGIFVVATATLKRG